MINVFNGTYSFLSNYYECPVTVDGITFRSSEAAFQAQKCAEPALRREFADLSPDVMCLLGLRQLLSFVIIT